MNISRYAATLLLSSYLTVPALAQSTPPPPKNSTAATAQTAAEQMGQVLFSAAEKKIIEGFFGHSATATAQQTANVPTGDSTSTVSGRILKQVLDTVTGQSASTAGTSSGEQGGEGAEGGEGGKADKGKNKGKKNKKNKNKGKKKGKGKINKMPKGLANRKSLPPGLQKQFEKNGKLPSGLAKRELPNDLNSQLPPEKKGTERIISGANVVLVDQATGIVLDILRDVVAGNK